MKAKIFSFVKISDDSMVASVRIAKYVSEVLQLPIHWDESIADEKCDTLIIINGAYAFAGSEILEALGTAILNADRIVWVQNDYTVIPPKDEGSAESPFRKAFRTRHETGRASVDYWTTCQDFAKAGGRSPTGHYLGDRSKYFNWNALTMDVELDPIRPWSERTHRGVMFYYGSFRKDRRPEFDKFFDIPKVPIMISCPNDKFVPEYPLCSHIGKVPLKHYSSQFGLGLYLEDRASHKSFHSPANRFYEMMSAGLPMVFQQEASRMMERAGYDIDDYTIWSGGEQTLENFMARGDQMAYEQRERWAPKMIAERLNLHDSLIESWRRYA